MSMSQELTGAYESEAILLSVFKIPVIQGHFSIYFKAVDAWSVALFAWIYEHLIPGRDADMCTKISEQIDKM